MRDCDLKDSDILTTVYLTSCETKSLLPVRRCIRQRVFSNDVRNDLILFRIDPPLHVNPQYANGLEFETDSVVLASRVGSSLLGPITLWPVAVYVVILNPNVPNDREVLSKSDYVNYAWADAFPTKSLAEKAAGDYASAF